MEFNGQGAATGAVTGAGLGASFGPIGLGVGAAAGGLAGGLGLFGGKPKSAPAINIDAEMAKIAALFEAQRKAAVSGINYEAGQGRIAAASNLAGRGIYRSGASQNTYNALDAARVNAIAKALGDIGGQEASVRGGFLAKLLDMSNDNANKRADAAAAGQSALFSQLGGLGSSLLLNALRPGAGAVAAPGASVAAPMPSPSNSNAYSRALYANAFR